MTKLRQLQVNVRDVLSFGNLRQNATPYDLSASIAPTRVLISVEAALHQVMTHESHLIDGCCEVRDPIDDNNNCRVTPFAAPLTAARPKDSKFISVQRKDQVKSTHPPRICHPSCKVSSPH